MCFFHLNGLALWLERIVYGTMENTNERFSCGERRRNEVLGPVASLCFVFV